MGRLKMEARKSRRNINIEEFVKFFTEKVKKEENVSFIKGNTKPEVEKLKNKIKMYQNNIRVAGKNPRNFNHPNGKKVHLNMEITITYSVYFVN